jgi:ParB family transcriptional regulator, chromosome partitioning protein
MVDRDMAEKPIKSRGLGRGLSALMSDVTAEGDVADRPRRPDLSVPVERLHPNPHQPRRAFPPDALAELAASIREKGVIQPLIVRAHPTKSGDYEIVAGERRWRAAQIAQLHDLPVIVRNYTDTEVLEVAIIENIQRSDLNAMDEAAGYRQLMDRFGHTQDQLATALGKSRSHIANQMRLLTLPQDVQGYVTDGYLTAGHARTLVGHPMASDLARRIIHGKLSVREAERLVKAGLPAPRAPSGDRAGLAKDADTVQIERELAAAIGMGVSIEHKAGEEGGRLILRYRTLAQLDDLLRALSGG